MTKKKKAVSESEIIEFYMDYVATHSEKPDSVDKFSITNGFTEDQFYEYFESFEDLDKSIFAIFFEHTIAMLERSDDYFQFDPRNKLLSFYYTFFELLAANRDYVVNTLDSGIYYLKGFKTLSRLKKVFTSYVASLNIKTIDLKQEQLNDLQTKSLKETAWLQLLLTLKFWIEDSSKDFEKTDVLIEKSVKASFDLIDTTALESLIDLGKFLFKEKTNWA